MPFATAEDVATRLGRSLDPTEAAKVDGMLEAATANIAAAADKNDAWAAALSPVPNVLHFLAIELVIRAMPNPGGLRSQSETLGAYQSSQAFRDDSNGGGLALTQVEESLVRRTVYGTTTASIKTESLADDLYACS